MSSRFETLTGVTDRGFAEYEAPPAAPMSLVRQWIEAAREEKVREPLSLALATADARGRASNRMVTVVELSGQGLVFTSHSSSQKGKEIAATGWASGLLYWRENARQLIVSGPVETLPEAESDRLWAARAAPLHPMTTVSRQSDPLDDADRLLARAGELAKNGVPLPRPERFVGYHLKPDVVEFWAADPGRLHRRLRYDRTAEGWSTVRLQP
ncbi:pyridoxamine 5'-phosphate oxidase [Nocardiopsis terrae]|uniref:Pyridoxamine 5'-phosphate oxidase n=1 Tax=Nocardiopsis terrae TaxID=372655 RepID=A0ABR9HMK8_9ACTN|nr:phenazine biosynthesis FMN-dependent oxidase PhzG [Nocardiopsis terrae]MBE1460250.1 pyridoxamine 5'-phosphate oxidase [Nocardiopsis terrae]GHC70476.1 pyridoxamine 5'-phosphate oxidase [Nocardiopsis terrae]